MREWQCPGPKRRVCPALQRVFSSCTWCAVRTDLQLMAHAGPSDAACKQLRRQSLLRALHRPSIVHPDSLWPVTWIKPLRRGQHSGSLQALAHVLLPMQGAARQALPVVERHADDRQAAMRQQLPPPQRLPCAPNLERMSSCCCLGYACTRVRASHSGRESCSSLSR